MLIAAISGDSGSAAMVLSGGSLEIKKVHVID